MERVGLSGIGCDSLFGDCRPAGMGEKEVGHACLFL